jgi:hypothetical protein
MRNTQRIYFKDGVPYFKRGGFFYPLKAQVGIDDINQIQTNLMSAQNNAEQFEGEQVGPSRWDQFVNYAKENPTELANYTATMLGSMNNDQNKYQPSAMVSRTMSDFDSEGTSNLANTALNAASLIPGAAPITKGIQAALNVGKAAANLVENKDNTGEASTAFGEVAGSILNPLGLIDESRDLYTDVGGGMAGAKAFAKNIITGGTSGRKYRKNKYAKAKKREDYLEGLGEAAANQGNYRNDGIYSAKRGALLSKLPMRNNMQPNLEIEDGEILLGDPSQISIPHGVKASTSMESPVAAKFHGDKHGEDKDKDGREGIQINAQGGYIASNYLDKYGRKVKKNKKGGKAKNKTVAQEMEPYVKMLNEADENPDDPYKNNPIAINHSVEQLNNIKNMAETNKFRRELEKMIKNDEIPFDEIINFIAENAPTDNFNEQEMGAIQNLIQQTRPQEQQPQGDMQEAMPPELLQQMMAQQEQEAPQMPAAKYGKKMKYKMQQGGMPQDMMAEDQQPENESQNRMEQLQAQAQLATEPNLINPSVNELDGDIQQMYAQLPPEIQQQLISLPPEQLEIAIINAYQSLMSQGEPEDMNQMAPALPMSEAPGMGQAEGPMPEGMEQMPMDEQAMMDAVQQQVMMMMGGDVDFNTYTQNRPGYTDKYQGDQFRSPYYKKGGDLQMKNEAMMNERLAHLPRNEYKELYNPTMGNHTKPLAAFQDSLQVGGAIEGDLAKLYQQYMSMGYSKDSALQMAKNKLNEYGDGGIIYSQRNKNNSVKPGMNVKFKMGGKVYQGKVKKVNPDGSFEM